MNGQNIVINRETFEIELSSLNLPELRSMSEDSLIKDVLDTMQSNRIGSVTFEKQGELSGIVTERDLLMKILKLGSSWKDQKISDVMTKKPFAFKHSDLVIDAIQKMSKKEFRHLPILNDDGKPINMISIKDLMKKLISFFPQTIKAQGIITDWNYLQVDNYDENFSSNQDQQGIISENIFLLPLGRVTDRPCLLLDVSVSIQESIEAMMNYKVGSVLLMKYDTILEGIFTERDLLFKVLGKIDLSKTQPIANFMTHNPHTLLTKHYIAHAINNMFHFNYRNTILVNEDKHPLHMVSSLDIFKFLSGYLFE